MIPLFRILICGLLLTAAGRSAKAQALEGRVLDAAGAPVPYANLFVEELTTGTSSDDLGNYYLRLPVRGDYRLIVSALGYTSSVDTVVVGDNVLQRDFRLRASAADLAEVVVQAGRRDPAYAIMREASERRREHLTGAGSYRVQVYLKAREDVDKLPGNKRDQRKAARREAARLEAELEAKQERIGGIDAANSADDAAAAERLAAERKLLGRINLLESQFALNYEAPSSYKEERAAIKSYGDRSGLLVPTFGDGDFNFYRNQIDFGSLAENKLISPLASTAVLSYKFKLLETLAEADELVHVIKVEPRKGGNATLSGTVYINAESYSINRVGVDLPRGALKLLDELHFEQTYAEVVDSVWLPVRQVFAYETKEGRTKAFRGRTTLRYSDYELGVTFDDKFFGGELANTDMLAYKRDTSYWNGARAEALEADEAEVVRLRDSISRRVNSVEYKDSIETAYNRIQLLDIAWDGIGFRNHRSREELWFGPLPSIIDFSVVGGWRLGPYVQYGRTFADGKRVFVDAHPSVGITEGDVQGDAAMSVRYDPMRLADVWVRGGKRFESINDFDAFLNQLSRDNYILVQQLEVGQRIEVMNGLYVNALVGFAERRPAPIIGSETFLSELIDDAPPIPFEPYETLWTEIGLEFTPFQKYLTEPTQKVVLGSKWPTIGVRHKRGWNGVAGSDVDYDYLGITVRQRLQLGMFGNARYQVEAGEFVNSRDLRFVDLRRFRQSDPILWSDPLRSFQLLDTALTATKPFFEAHAIHHFNGALMNNLPLIKLTRLEVVAGGGAMWLTEGAYRHVEGFAGLERVFKLGARRRLRLGVYGVVAESRAFGRDQTIKVSVDVIDTWKKDWSF